MRGFVNLAVQINDDIKQQFQADNVIYFPPSGYHSDWTIRLHLLVNSWIQHGPDALHDVKAGNICVSELAISMPDQKGWLDSLCEKRSEPLIEFTRRLGYDDVNPLVSMWPCVILCAEVLQSNLADIGVEDLAKIIHKYWIEKGHVAVHPSRLSALYDGPGR